MYGFTSVSNDEALDVAEVGDFGEAGSAKEGDLGEAGSAKEGDLAVFGLIPGGIDAAPVVGKIDPLSSNCFLLFCSASSFCFSSLCIFTDSGSLSLSDEVVTGLSA
jgi:hypothetical protein